MRNDSARDTSAWRASHSCKQTVKEKDIIVNEIRYIAASLVGAGIDRVALNEALESHPHFIACDAGTTDAGPFSLGSGHPAFGREAVKNDLALLLDAGRRAGVPVLVGSAGTSVL